MDLTAVAIVFARALLLDMDINAAVLVPARCAFTQDNRSDNKRSFFNMMTFCNDLTIWSVGEQDEGEEREVSSRLFRKIHG